MPYARSAYPRPSFNTRRRYLGGVVERRRKAVATARLKLAKPVRKLVDRRIDRQIETKVLPFHYRRTQWDNVPDQQARCCQLLQNLIQGDQRDERNGSKIKLTSMNIRGYIQIPSYEEPGSADRSNIMFRLCVLSCKAEHMYPEVLANWAGPGNWFTKLLKSQADDTPPTGITNDMWKDINRDLFTVHYDKVYTFSRGDQNGNNITPAATLWRPDKMKHFFIKMKVKNKVLNYATEHTPGTNEGIQPTNFAPFLVGWWSYTNGANAGNTPVPYIEYYVKTRFKDA